eukprot:UN18595
MNTSTPALWLSYFFPNCCSNYLHRLFLYFLLFFLQRKHQNLFHLRRLTPT